MPEVLNSNIRNNYHALVRKDIFPLVPKMGGTLLDFGGGVGETAAALKSSGKVDRAGVIDLVSPARKNPELDFHQSGNVENISFLKGFLTSNGPFSVILCLDVLEHIRNPWEIINILHSALTQDGVIVASIPNMRYYKATFPLFFLGKWELEDSGIRDRTHLRWFVKDTAVDLMTSSGLELEEVKSNLGGGRKVRLVNAVTFGLLRGFAEMQYLIRVRNRN